MTPNKPTVSSVLQTVNIETFALNNFITHKHRSATTGVDDLTLQT